MSCVDVCTLENLLGDIKQAFDGKLSGELTQLESTLLIDAIILKLSEYVPDTPPAPVVSVVYPDDTNVVVYQGFLNSCKKGTDEVNPKCFFYVNLALVQNFVDLNCSLVLHPGTQTFILNHYAEINDGVNKAIATACDYPECNDDAVEEVIIICCDSDSGSDCGDYDHDDSDSDSEHGDHGCDGHGCKKECCVCIEICEEGVTKVVYCDNDDHSDDGHGVGYNPDFVNDGDDYVEDGDGSEDYEYTSNPSYSYSVGSENYKATHYKQDDDEEYYECDGLYNHKCDHYYLKDDVYHKCNKYFTGVKYEECDGKYEGYCERSYYYKCKETRKYYKCGHYDDGAYRTDKQRKLYRKCYDDYSHQKDYYAKTQHGFKKSNCYKQGSSSYQACDGYSH